MALAVRIQEEEAAGFLLTAGIGWPSTTCCKQSLSSTTVYSARPTKLGLVLYTFMVVRESCVWQQGSTLRRRHSLTHCCAWPAEGRSVLHIERSCPAIQAAPTDRPVSSSNCCSQFLRGWPGGHRALPVSSGRSASVGFYWQLQCLRSRCVLR